MNIFAKVENGIVTSIIVADQEFIDSGTAGDPSQWLESSKSIKDDPIRGFHAVIGNIYDSELDIFYPTSPYPSWVFNKQTLEWQAPIEMPFPPNQTATPVSDGFKYFWNEDILNWDKNIITFKQDLLENENTIHIGETSYTNQENVKLEIL